MLILPIVHRVSIPRISTQGFSLLLTPSVESTRLRDLLSALKNLLCHMPHAPFCMAHQFLLCRLQRDDIVYQWNIFNQNRHGAWYSTGSFQSLRSGSSWPSPEHSHQSSAPPTSSDSLLRISPIHAALISACLPWPPTTSDSQPPIRAPHIFTFLLVREHHLHEHVHIAFFSHVN